MGQVTTRGRRLTTTEMLKLQHMKPGRIILPPKVTLAHFHGMIGNSMSVNIIESLLVMLHRAAPDVMGLIDSLHDRWSAAA